MPRYIDSERYSAWHIPCFTGYNCPDDEDLKNDNATVDYKSQVEHAGISSSSSSDDGKAVAGFLCFLAVISILLITAVAAALIKPKTGAGAGNRRTLLLSYLSTLLLITALVIPIHAAVITKDASSKGLCQTWVYLHVATLSVVSWTLPSVAAFAYFVGKGSLAFAKWKYLLVIAWPWLGSMLLAVPAAMDKGQFGLVDFDTCALNVGQETFAIAFYVTTAPFFLPCCVCLPVFLTLLAKVNREEVIAEADEDKPFNEDAVERERKSPRNHLKEQELSEVPNTLLALSLTHSGLWFCFFVLLLLHPFFGTSLPYGLAVASTLIGYSEVVIAPVLLIALIDAIRWRLMQFLTVICKCEKRAENSDNRVTSPPSE